MRTDIRAVTILGIKIPKDFFWKKLGTRRQCSKCGRAMDADRFCFRDGRPAEVSAIKEPTPALKLMLEYWEKKEQSGKIDPTLESMMRGNVQPTLYFVKEVQDSDHHGDAWAFGFEVGLTCSLRDRNERQIKARSYEEVEGMVKELREVAAMIGLEGAIRIFTCLYLG